MILYRDMEGEPITYGSHNFALSDSNAIGVGWSPGPISLFDYELMIETVWGDWVVNKSSEVILHFYGDRWVNQR